MSAELRELADELRTRGNQSRRDKVLALAEQVEDFATRYNVPFQEIPLPQLPSNIFPTPLERAIGQFTIYAEDKTTPPLIARASKKVAECLIDIHNQHLPRTQRQSTQEPTEALQVGSLLGSTKNREIISAFVHSLSRMENKHEFLPKDISYTTVQKVRHGDAMYLDTINRYMHLVLHKTPYDAEILSKLLGLTEAIRSGTEFREIDVPSQTHLEILWKITMMESMTVQEYLESIRYMREKMTGVYGKYSIDERYISYTQVRKYEVDKKNPQLDSLVAWILALGLTPLEEGIAWILALKQTIPDEGNIKDLAV